MKIAASTINTYSENFLNQMDLEFSQETQKKHHRIINKPGGQNFGDNPGILIDRINIQTHSRFDFKYNYSGSLKTESTVKSMDSGEIEKIGHEQIIEKLVGGVIDKSVVIQNIKEEKDIIFTEKNSPEPDSNNSRKLTLRNLNESTAAWKMELKKTDIHFEEEAVQFNSSGQVTTTDGRVIDFSLDLNMNRTFLSRTEETMLIERWKENINLTDPLVISLDGSIPRLSDTQFEFDINSDGHLENLKFASSGSGFLAFDKNADNIINNGSELFGPGTGNGFSELATLDEDGNRWIDENDSVFEKLSVWTKDENGSDRLVSLKDAGIGAISLENSSTLFNLTDSENNLEGKLRSSGVFLFENGRVGAINQIDLAEQKTDPLNPENIQSVTKDPSDTQNAGTNELVSPPGILQPDNLQQMNEALNPLQELLDRLEKLKQEMEALLEKMNPVSDQNASGRRSRKKYFNPELRFYSLMDMYKPGKKGRSIHL